MGAFGLLGHTQNDILPADRIAEFWPSVDAQTLRRKGWMDAVGSQPGVGGPGKIILESTTVLWRWHAAIPNVVTLQCPVCGAGRYRLHRVGVGEAGRWCCVGCAKLERASRHRDRSIRGLARLRRLRKLAGASPIPFSELPSEPPPRPRGMARIRRHLRHLAEIRAIERSLIAHADDICGVLERRNGRRRKGQHRS